MKKEQQLVVAYEPPKVEIIEVEVEKGFAGSLTGYGSDSDDSEFGSPNY